MAAIDLQQMELNIARCRIVLSVAAILVVYIDPDDLRRYTRSLQESK